MGCEKNLSYSFFALVESVLGLEKIAVTFSFAYSLYQISLIENCMVLS